MLHEVIYVLDAKRNFSRYELTRFKHANIVNSVKKLSVRKLTVKQAKSIKENDWTYRHHEVYDVRGYKELTEYAEDITEKKNLLEVAK